MAAGSQVTLNGTQYTIVANKTDDDDSKNLISQETLLDRIDKDKITSVKYGGKTYNVLAGNKDANDSSIINAETAYDYMAKELILANNVGATENDGNATKAAANSKDAANNDVRTFTITKGTAKTKEDLNFSLHVGADADMTNKIGVKISSLDTTGLGISGLNVKDSTGASATYAIDSIAGAVAKVSAQRSALGAVQNRLEHTINNLDNVVENTTSAESQIRDTDMAEEMVKYSKNNILQQAGQSMLAQANQSNQGVLSLLG